jgi:anti-anti-sigma factor
MEIVVSEAQGKVPVTILKTRGDIDGSNYGNLLAKAQAAYETGVRNILLDLSETEFMSSAGLVALQGIAKLMRGEGMMAEGDGWDALHEIDRDREKGYQPHFKILNPQPQIEKSLNTVGFSDYIKVFTDQDEAVASFG